jgi:16S rRNA (guanine(1405)-N(7))-methyltransferase
MSNILLEEKILTKIKSSGKYSQVYEGTIRKIIAMMVTRFGKEKEIEKNVKKKLHQIYGAYFTESQGHLDKSGGSESGGVLMKHVSTAERVGFYDEFYGQIFAILSDGKDSKKYKIYDAACGYNPFSAEYFKDRVEVYHCSDIDVELNDNLNSFFVEKGLTNFSSSNKDLTIDEINFSNYDVVFLFKTLSCIERQEKGSAKIVLDKTLRAKSVVVSFPSKSIGGKEKGMRENYASFLDELLVGHSVHKTVINFQNETVYVLLREK